MNIVMPKLYSVGTEKRVALEYGTSILLISIHIFTTGKAEMSTVLVLW
jgi:hypothetical protein